MDYEQFSVKGSLSTRSTLYQFFAMRKGNNFQKKPFNGNKIGLFVRLTNKTKNFRIMFLSIQGMNTSH